MQSGISLILIFHRDDERVAHRATMGTQRRALPRWMRLLPGEAEKLLVGAGGRCLAAGKAFFVFV